MEDEGKMKSFVVTTAHNARVDLGELSTYLQCAHSPKLMPRYCSSAQWLAGLHCTFFGPTAAPVTGGMAACPLLQPGAHR